MDTIYLIFFGVFLGFYLVLFLVLLFSNQVDQRARRPREHADDGYQEELLELKL